MNLIALLIGLLTLSPAVASAASGGDPFNTFFLDPSARVSAMGGAYTSLATDANALRCNPAGLGGIRRHEAVFMHNQYFEGIVQESVGLATREGWGLDLTYLNTGSVAKTTISNPDGIALGEASFSDFSVAVGYGKALNERWSFGAATRLVRQSIADVSAQGFAVDIGALYAVRSVKGLALGAAVQNIGAAVKFQSTKEKLPLNLKAGGSYAFDLGGRAAVVSLDASKAREEGVVAQAGAEVVVAGVIPVRVGLSTRNQGGLGLTAGLGLIRGNLSFDFALIPFGPMGMTHRLSATVRWGGE